MADRVSSPYLKNPQRLEELCRLGESNFRRQRKGEFWKNIFLDHPEFFRINSSEKAVSLVLRRTYQKRYYVDIEKTVTKEECDRLKAEGKGDRISRTPLSNQDIQMPINTAINLHSRALEGK